MRASFLLLAICNLLVLGLTAVIGFTVDAGGQRQAQHILLGILTALFTCLVHTVYFMYFVVQEKIFERASRLDVLDPGIVHRVRGFKLRAIRLSMTCIVIVLAVVMLGGATAWGMPAEVHLVAAMAAIAVQFALLFPQVATINACLACFRSALGD